MKPISVAYIEKPLHDFIDWCQWHFGPQQFWLIQIRNPLGRSYRVSHIWCRHIVKKLVTSKHVLKKQKTLIGHFKNHTNFKLTITIKGYKKTFSKLNKKWPRTNLELIQNDVNVTMFLEQFLMNISYLLSKCWFLLSKHLFP